MFKNATKVLFSSSSNTEPDFRPSETNVSYLGWRGLGGVLEEENEDTKDKAVAQVALTGAWEKVLGMISNGTFDAPKFMKGFARYTSEITQHLLELGKSITVKDGPDVDCPKCKVGKLVFYDKMAGWDKFSEGCDFKIFRSMAGVMLPYKVSAALIKNGSAPEIKNFKKKAGEKFAASLVLDDNFDVKFKFTQARKKRLKRNLSVIM